MNSSIRWPAGLLGATPLAIIQQRHDVDFERDWIRANPQEHDVDLLGAEVQFRLEGGLLPILYSSGHIGCRVYVLYPKSSMWVSIP